MSRCGALLVVLAAGVCVGSEPRALARTQAHAAPSAASVTQAEEARVRDRLSRILGHGRRLRDFAAFTTEHGEPAFLVLFLTQPIFEPSPDEKLEEPMSCPEMVEGIALGGIYHVGLVINGRLVNEVRIPRSTPNEPEPPVPTIDFPLRNTPDSNYRDYGQAPARVGSASGDVEPTKLIKLADYNGDGHAWEFRLVRTEGGCSGVETLLAGYSASQGRAILYPVIVGKDLSYWYPDFFPPPTEPNAATVHYEPSACQFSSSETEGDAQFEYNPSLEAWILTRVETHLCVLGDPAQPTNVDLRIGSRRGHRNEVVSFAVSANSDAGVVDGMELHMPLGNGLQVLGCTGRPALSSNVKTSDAGIDVILNGMSCMMSSHNCGESTDVATLLTCAVAIDADADLGTHELAPTSVVLGNGRDRLPFTLTTGEIVVEPAADGK
jgi:hypothetical protein